MSFSKICENDLVNYANFTNELVINNSMLKELIQEYNNYIKLLKEFFPNFNNNNKEEILKENIKKLINDSINKLQETNNNLKKTKEQINNQYYKKLEEKHNYLQPLINTLDKEKEDKFILENQIMSKDTYLKIYRGNIIKIRQFYINDYQEEIRERYINKNSKKINSLLESESEKIQKLLNDYSKDLNKLTNESENNQLEIKKLKKILNSNTIRKRLNTEQFYYDNNLNEEEEEINDNLIFNEFEIESNYSNDSISFSEDESYINYDLDLDINQISNNRTQNKSNLFNLNKMKIPLNERLFTSDYKEIPKLNLKQIEFNKIRVVTEGFDEDDTDNEKKSIQYQIYKMKKKIKKENKKKKNYMNIISNFKSHYKTMKNHIKKLTLHINNNKLTNEITFPKI